MDYTVVFLNEDHVAINVASFITIDGASRAAVESVLTQSEQKGDTVHSTLIIDHRDPARPRCAAVMRGAQ